MNGAGADIPIDEQKKVLYVVMLHWTFTLAAARQKLRKCYPSNED